MDEGPKASKKLTEDDWNAFYVPLRDTLIKEEARLQTQYNRMHRDAEESGNLNVHQPTESIARELVQIYQNLRHIWERTDTERKWLIEKDRQITEFLGKFQKWMDRYGPMLESELEQWQKVARP